MMKRRNLSMKLESKRTGLLCRGLLAGLFFWAGLGGSQGQTPGLTYPVPIDEEHFPDAVFREVVNSYDRNRDGSLSVEECGNVKELSINYSEDLTSLEGIRYFYALTYLDCSSNQLTSLDLSGLTALTYLDCSGYNNNQLTSLDLSGLTALTTLDCSFNQLTSLDLSNCNALTTLDCSSNQLTSLDLSNCNALTNLDCSSNQLTSLDVSGCTALTELDCSSNDLKNLDVSGLTALTNLDCLGNHLTSLDVSGLTALTNLDCYSNQLTSLDVSGCTALTGLNCAGNQLASLDVSGCTALTVLGCSFNQLTSLDVGGLTTLTGLDCSDNNLTSLDVSGCTVLELLVCDRNHNLFSIDLSGCITLVDLSIRDVPLICLDLSHCTALDFYSIEFVTMYHPRVALDDSNRIRLPDLIRAHGGDMAKVLDIRTGRGCTYSDSVVQFFDSAASLAYMYETGKGGMQVSLHPASFNDYMVVAIDEEHFPDFNFRRYVQENHDKNRNEMLEASESCCRDGVSHKSDIIGWWNLIPNSGWDHWLFSNISGLDISDMGIADLTGIEYLRLEALVCQDNTLETLDLTRNPELRYVDCSGNVELSRIEMADDGLLLALDCNRTALDLKQALPRWTKLVSLDCRAMGLTELDLEHPALRAVACNNNRIDTLSLAGTGIEVLYCAENGMRRIDFGTDTLQSLREMDCSFNSLTGVDLSFLPNLWIFGFLCNRLACVDMSGNAEIISWFYFLDNQDSTGNYHGVVLDGSRKMALSSIPGLDASRMANLQGGTIQGDSLTFVKDTVSYFYYYRCPNPDVPLGGYFSLYLMETEPVRIDEANFPDEIFRTYVSEHLDSSANGYLDGKEATIKALDVSGLGIRNLKGIGNFADLESLDCSDNQLTSLDLSLNTKLTELDATGNVLKVSLDDANRLELSALPGFDPAKASDWTGAQVENGQLQFLQAAVSYAYETGYQGEAELPEVRFRLDAGNGEAEIAVSEANFPDAVFRIHVGGQIDRSGNDSLDIVERTNVRALEVPGLGIQDLRGIGYFNKLENLDCSGNELTSLDLSGNPELRTLNATGNQLDITLDASNGFDLSFLPGFDLAKASGWEGGTRLGNILTFSQREVTYAYATGYSGSTEDESLSSVRFSLRADRDPGVANESMATKPQGKVYAKEHVIYIEGIEGEISVFTPSGMLLYQGHGKEIPVRNDGLYLVRSGQQVWKVLVL